MSSFKLKVHAAASVQTPESGAGWVFLDEDGALKTKNEFGVVIGSGTVTAVNDVSPDSAGNIELTAASIGLSEVENLSPANMPVSDATQLALEDVAADAAADATDKANAAQAGAQTYADTKAGAAQANAISAAATDASTKAAAAQAAAISAAAADATSKANAAAAASVPTSAVGSTVASLVAGTVPASQLPSYVDDVLEYANLGAFPGSGEAGKIYVAVNGAIPSNPSKQYRWSGSAYTEISPSPGTTDALTEGASNLYLTAARVRNTLLAGLSVATNAAITAADDVLGGMGKLQAQLTAAITGLSATVRGTVLTGLSLASAVAVTATDTVLIAIGKLQAQVTARLGRQEAGGTDLSLGAIPDGTWVKRSGAVLVGEEVAALGTFKLTSRTGPQANRPAASAATDLAIRLVNLGDLAGFARSIWQESNGADWAIVQGRAVLYRNSTPGTVVTLADASLTPIGPTPVIPGGLMGLRTQLWITLHVRASTNNAANTIVVYLGGQPLYSTTGTWYDDFPLVRVGNAGALNSQTRLGPGNGGTGMGQQNLATTYKAALTLDTTLDQSLTFAVAGVAATDMQIMSIMVELVES